MGKFATTAERDAWRRGQAATSPAIWSYLFTWSLGKPAHRPDADHLYLTLERYSLTEAGNPHDGLTLLIDVTDLSVHDAMVMKGPDYYPVRGTEASEIVHEHSVLLASIHVESLEIYPPSSEDNLGPGSRWNQMVFSYDPLLDG